MQTILVVDTDAESRSGVTGYLSAQGFKTFTACDAEEMDGVLAENPIDLIIVDVQLHGEGGLSICQRLRGPDSPGIILVSRLADEVDRVIGLEMGADDFLPKPVALRELLARTRSLLRRRIIPSDVRRFARGYVFRDVHFRHAERQLANRSGKTLDLTEQESVLLRKFLDHPSQVLERAFLSHVPPSPSDASNDLRAVDVQISRLRQKLVTQFGIDPIRTLRGKGYVLDAEVAQA